MKRLLLYLLICLPPVIYAQQGFKVIRKAERKFETGSYKQALKLLSQAEKMNYGWCGNAWIDASMAIAELRAQIYIEQEEYQLAINSIDSIEGWEYWYTDDLDSLKLRAYQFKIGADSLKNMIDASLLNTSITCGKYNCLAVVPLSNGKDTINLRVGYDFILEFESSDIPEKEKVKKWLAVFLQSPVYKLIKQSPPAG